MPCKVQNRREIIPASHAQLSSVADGLGDLGLTVWIMRGCGLRIAEALAVESGDFRDGYATLRVQRQLRDGQTTPLKARGAGEYRDVPVPTWLTALVKRYVMAHGSGRLFTLGYSAFIVQWRKHVRSAGLPVDFTPHQLRHAYASTLLSQLVPITDVARWLGHRGCADQVDSGTLARAEINGATGQGEPLQRFRRRTALGLPPILPIAISQC
jgi:integrase